MRTESHHATFAASINLMKISTLIPLIACVLAGTCHAYQLVGTEALSEELIARHYTINPNLDAVIVVDRTIPTFEYQTFYCAGSADEAEGEQGRIHFLEHIISNTGSHEPGKLNQIIMKNGGQNNAATLPHFTRFILRFPKDKFGLAIEIDKDRFYNTTINEEVVKREKKIILIERSRTLASSTRRFSYSFLSLLYGKKNFNGLGTEAFIEQLEPDDLKAYYENFLRLQKRLIVIIGDVEVDHVLAKLNEAYGQDQRPSKVLSKSSMSQFPNPEVLGKRFRLTGKKLNFARFWKHWYTPDLSHRDYAGLLILTNLLNALRTNLVKSGLATSSSVSLDSIKGFGLMSCYVESPHDTSRNKLHAMIQARLEKLKSVSEEDFNAARNQKLRTMYSSFYDRSSMAHSFGQAFAQAGDPLLYPKLFKIIQSIRTEDIPRIIDQYLTDDNSITLSLTLSR